MADQQDAAGTAPRSEGDGVGAELEDARPGQWLDWAGGLAAVILVIIVADIFTDGRLISARLLRWRDRGGGDGDLPAGPADGH